MNQSSAHAGPPDTVLTERRGEVAWITLNAPERLNAFDADMLRALTTAVEESEDAGVIVITGAGRAFCSGGYLADLAEPSESLRHLYFGGLKLFEAMRCSPRPVIAAVNGLAAGGGNELVVACDLAIAAESAWFGQTGPRIGSSPVVGGTNMLSMAIGEKRAKEVVYLCRRYPADEALQMGWINAVVPDDQLEAEVDRWTTELLAKSPRYLEISKLSSNVWWNACRDSFSAGVGMLVQAIGSEDMLEGANAFMEKRDPQFRAKRREAGGRDGARPV